MKASHIPIKDTNYFSDIIIDYVNRDEHLKSFYGFEASIEGFKQQIESKSYSKDQRQNLCTALANQYKNDGVRLSEKHDAQLKLLEKENTFTVTTGHQLCLFTGPLYFIYKIISTIRLSEELSKAFPDYNFVPMYWMASEDHDFDEISFFNLPNGRVKWDTSQAGAVGRMSVDQLEELITQFEEYLPQYSTHAATLIELFKKSYQKNNLAAATRSLVSALFDNENLLIIDGDDPLLKSAMVDIFQDELLNQTAFQLIQKTSDQLSSKYKVQVNPREINLFYLQSNSRERIEFKGSDNYRLVDDSKAWSKEKLLSELQEFPERFSPNVILRPLYQEVILPNLAYIGGGGELAYWFQLKAMFAHYQVNYPILLLRNSAVFLNADESKIQSKLDLSNVDLFKDYHSLMKSRVESIADYDVQLKSQKLSNQELYQQLIKDVEAIDLSLIPHIESLMSKSDKNLQRLTKKLERVYKRKEEEYGSRIQKLKVHTFPNDSLQERRYNFSILYLIYGKEMVQLLKQNFSPLAQNFTVLKES